MSSLGSGLDQVDLGFLGHRGVIATGVIAGRGGVALVDPGPSTTLPALETGLTELGIGLEDVQAILLTHIHLDHAGASGSLIARCPRARVFVHRNGARHLIDPARLLASASRLYGPDMGRLWGDVRPVPADRVSVLEVGGPAGSDELVLDVSGHRIRVAWTPGHASHHVSYFVPGAGLAFIGDTAGLRRPGSPVVLPATPPPDIDLALWRESTSRILRWQPDTLFLTHFGPHRDPVGHLQRLWRRLDAWDRWTRASLEDEATDAERAARFGAAVSAELRRELGPEEVDAYAAAGRFDFSWMGLARAGRTGRKADAAGA